MTFILTALAVESKGGARPQASPLVLDRVLAGADAHLRAGFIPGLARHLSYAPTGEAFHVLLPDSDGWTSSNALFEVPEDDEEPSYLRIPDSLRESFTRIMTGLQRNSPRGRVMLILEYNGSVTAPDVDSSVVDVVGPISVAEFWRLHDLRELLEETIVIVDMS